jgi:hypothetical protein
VAHREHIDGSFPDVHGAEAAGWKVADELVSEAGIDATLRGAETTMQMAGEICGKSRIVVSIR